MDTRSLPPALLAALGLAHGCDLGPCLSAVGPCLQYATTCETAGTCESGTTGETGDTGASSPAPSSGDVWLELLGSDRLPPDVVERLRARRPR